MTGNKIAELNLEYGSPTVPVAILKMKNALTTYRGKGYKAVIVIHGYGSTGVGGGIKTAIRKCLDENSMRGIVRMFIGGEDWLNNRKSALAVCKDLEHYEHRIANNNGIVVVILRK